MEIQNTYSITPTDLCPCGSEENFEKCCFPLLSGRTSASTPEQLMRSRYTAFVLKNSSYLLETWDHTNRPNSLALEEDNTIWLGLQIHEAPLPKKDASTGCVHFSAISIQRGKMVTMREESRFVKKNGLWYYLDGNLQIKEKPISLKSPCPCGSGKKYKRCCAEGEEKNRYKNL